MFKFTAVVASVVVLVMPTVTQGDQPAQDTTTQGQVQAKPLRNGCKQLYTQHQFKHYARRVYRRRALTKRAGRQVHQMTLCQHSPRAERKMRKLRRDLRHQRKLRLELAALTPYGPCYGGYWAVPCEIIGGEAGWDWHTANSNGCVGPYQFCGWNVPWPVRTVADKLAHHRMAARLWRGGAGCSNWEQTSSAC